MKKKPTFEDLFDAAASEFEAAFLRSSTSSRPDEVGQPRELHLRRFLQEWLPSIYGVTNGYIIDVEGGISRQCDVALYDAPRCPKFLLDGASDRRLIPFPSAYGTIEVKSTLGEAELNDALEKLESVSTLKNELSGYYEIPKRPEIQVLAVQDERATTTWRWSFERIDVPEDQWDRYRVKIIPPEKARTPPLGLIFAYKFGADLSFERAHAIIQKAKHPPDGIFVLDGGYSLLLSKEAMKRYKSLSTGKPAAAFDLDRDVLNAWFAESPFPLAGSPPGVRYLTVYDAESKVVLLFLYSFLLDLLASQELKESAHTDMLAVWRRRQ